VEVSANTPLHSIEMRGSYGERIKSCNKKLHIYELAHFDPAAAAHAFVVHAVSFVRLPPHSRLLQQVYHHSPLYILHYFCALLLSIFII
jgi:hypothetical protein